MEANSNRPKFSFTSGIAIAVVQWSLLTIALGTMAIYTDRSMEGLLEFHLDSAWAFVGAMLVGYLLGATIEHAKWLIAMVVGSCAAAAGIYVALLFFPVWTGTLVQTVGLENFATTRALLYFGLSIVPVSLGALAGRLTAGWIPGGDLLERGEDGDGDGWWLDRTSSDDATSETR